MQELLRGAAGWCALLYSTHYMDEADALADDIAVLASGRLACHGSSLTLKVAQPLPPPEPGGPLFTLPAPDYAPDINASPCASPPATLMGMTKAT